MITDSMMPIDDLVRMAHAAGRAGVSEVMVRLPCASAGRMFDLAERMTETIAGSGATLTVHDRVDVALAIPGAAIHLGQRSLPVDVARRLAPDRRIGVSVHSVAEAREAEARGADVLQFGHVFETPSHPGQVCRGLESLRRVVDAVEIPIIAIGGITPRNVEGVLDTGASGVAVIRAISAASDPAHAVGALREALDRSDRPDRSEFDSPGRTP